MRRTQLYEKHKALGARFVEFAGWEMPLEYAGVVKEHEAVRESAGLFDVSHMGTFELGGKGVCDFLRKMLPFRPEALAPERARYTFLLNDHGGIEDDLMVFRLNGEIFLLVVNAATAEKDLLWLESRSGGFDATIINISPETSILALQGPRSWDIIRDVTGIDPAGFKYHSFVHTGFEGIGFMLAKTGYTGEKGFEIYVHNKAAERVWDRLMEAGRRFGIMPCGLGARDTLRLEMGYLLYGSDADEDTSPIEAGYEGFIDFENTEFIGRDALLKIKEEGPGRMLQGLVIKDHGIPRHGCAIFSGEEEAGVVTSGNFSPMLKRGIALGYIKTGKPLDDMKVEIRGKLHGAEVVNPPFYKK